MLQIFFKKIEELFAAEPRHRSKSAGREEVHREMHGKYTLRKEKYSRGNER